MRSDEFKRKTKETDIAIKLNIDGNGKYDIDTGVGFFDHMLELFACHSGFDLSIKCIGDLKVDAHHTVEDIGISLGVMIDRLLGDRKGIQRYAVSYIPMDESLARCVIDVSGRPYLKFNSTMSGKVGNFDCELIEEFFRAVVFNAKLTVHIDVLESGNLHHESEAIFKAFAHAISDSVKIIGDRILSSKGVL